MKLEYSGYIKDGKLFIRNRKQLDIELLGTGWTELDITFRKKSKNRSIQQNRYYWACLTLIGEVLGYRKEEVADIVKFKFLKREMVNETTGEVFEYLKSTTELTTTEFATYMDEIIQFAAEMNIVLPQPNEQISIL